MASTAYRDSIRQAYEGELIGEKLYRKLATRAALDQQKAKLNAIADVEMLTNARLRSIAERLGIHPQESEYQATIDRRANELAGYSWSAFISKALREWPPYIARFEAILPLAPPGDETAIRQLIEHEVVLVEFIRLEHAVAGGRDSQRLLEEFLERSRA
jgi:rubrerythrin